MDNKRKALTKGKKNNNESLVVVDPLKAYIYEIQRHPELSAEEEYELAVKYYKDGDPDAALKLVTANLMLVVKIAMKFKKEFQNLFDLIQEGNTGLMQAVKKFDPFKGVRLPSYATWWIKAYILKYIMDNWRLVKVGTTNSRRKLLYNLQKEKNRLIAEGYSPSPKLLAAHFGVSTEEVTDVEKSLGAFDISLHTPTGDEDQGTLIDIIPETKENVEEDYLKKHFRSDVRGMISSFKDTLKESDKNILDSRIMADNPDTLQDIADRFGITREAIRQAEKRLLDRLKKFIEKEYPDMADTGEVTVDD